MLDMSAGDWLAIRFAVAIDGYGYAAAQRIFGVSAEQIKKRSQREHWRAPEQIRRMPTMEEIINMRTQSEIMRTLNAMRGKLVTAMESGDDQEIGKAMKKGELIGKQARAIQSVARAAEVAATTNRKVKAHENSNRNMPVDREALGRKLAVLQEKLDQASLSGKSE